MFLIKNEIVNIKNKTANEIPNGATFMGTIGDYSDRLFLKTDKIIISLYKPDRYWTDKNCFIENYEEVDLEVTIIRKNK